MKYDIYDKAFQKALKDNPKQVLSDLNKQTNDIKIVVVTNTKNTTYISMPAYSYTQGDLQNIQAAGATVGSVGTGGTVGTLLGTVGSTASTLSTVGTAGTAGSAKVDINN